jgi:hypothetical protein
VESLRTVVATRKPPPRPVLDSLTAAGEQPPHGDPAPAWLPTSHQERTSEAARSIARAYR